MNFVKTNKEIRRTVARPKAIEVFQIIKVKEKSSRFENPKKPILTTAHFSNADIFIYGLTIP
jgi:hypothetical protein